MNMREMMVKRQSQRTYRDEQISEELRLKLEDYIKQAHGPFNTSMRFGIIDMNNAASGLKLGTYGVIKGAKSFICTAVKKEKRYEENLGYTFEKIILQTTSIGLGTCWLGGTFKRGEFGRAMELSEDEYMPVITPIGYTRESRSVLDSLMVFAAGSRNRKDWSELFFEDSFEKTLKKDDLGKLAEAFEMVRVAPSASNKQPWRIVRDRNRYHFYLRRNKGYGNIMEFDIQRLDIGIAMCHFELAAEELGYQGEWNDSDPGISLTGDTEYIITYTMDNK